MSAQVLQAIGYPINVLLAGQYHLTFDAGALRAGNHEQIRNPGDHDPEICARAVLPFRSDRRSGIRMNIDLFHCPRHRIEAGGKDDRIERVVGIGRAQSARRNFCDRLASDIDQGDVVAIVGLVVVGIENQPFGADRMIVRTQQLCGSWILDGGADLLAYEL